MKIKKNSGGSYSAVLSNRSIPLGTSDPAEARRLAKAANLDQVDLAHRAGVLTATAVQRLTFGRTVTCQRALDGYLEWGKRANKAPLTVHRYHQTAAAFLAAHLAKPVQIVTEKMISEFVNPDDGSALGTRNCRLSALVSFFGFCSAKGFMLGNPAALVGVQTHELTHDQMEPKPKVPVFVINDLDELPVFYRLVALLGLTCGLRISGVAGLEWSSFIIPSKMVIFTDKNRTRMEFGITAEVAAVLAEVPRLDPELVFPEEYVIAKSPTRRALLSTTFKRLTGVNAHQLRHDFATRLALEGETVTDIQKRLGHTSPETTKTYVHT